MLFAFLLNSFTDRFIFGFISAKSEYQCFYGHEGAALEALLQEAKLNQVPAEVFCEQRHMQRHNFEVGMHLEMLCPESHAEFYPATVTEILSPYFVVQQDLYQKSMQMLPMDIATLRSDAAMAGNDSDSNSMDTLLVGELSMCNGTTWGATPLVL